MLRLFVILFDHLLTIREQLYYNSGHTLGANKLIGTQHVGAPKCSKRAPFLTSSEYFAPNKIRVVKAYRNMFAFEYAPLKIQSRAYVMSAVGTGNVVPLANGNYLLRLTLLNLHYSGKEQRFNGRTMPRFLILEHIFLNATSKHYLYKHR